MSKGRCFMSQKWQLILVFLAAGACSGRAALIAGWNFNSQIAGTAPSSIAADHGSGSLDLSHLANSADANIGASSSGTSVNARAGDSSGRDFYVKVGSNPGENGKSVVFAINTSGYKDIVLTYATYKTDTGFASQQWSYSTDGANYTSFATITGMQSSYSYTGVEQVDFTAVPTLNN